MPTLSAALITIFVALCTPLSAQSNSTTLPSLGNSANNDRVMLREISDVYVHNIQNPVPASTTPFFEARQTRPSAADVWGFVQRSTRLPIPDHETISFHREKYRQEAIWITRTLERATPFVGHVVEELDKRYLPVELALLPAIESAFQPDVHSPQNAAGIWQIMPKTADDIGIRSSEWFDGRSDIRDSTRSAIDYLSYLNAEFHGDWLHTLAAYNGGLGRVRSAINRNVNAGLPIDFWSLKLPRETHHYVPKFLALLAILRFDKPEALKVPLVARGSAFDLVDTGQRTSLSQLAQIMGIDERQIRLLNAGLVKGITPPAGPHLVYVPQGVGAQLVNALNANTQLSLFSRPEQHVVVAGDTLSAITRRYRISQQKLRSVNNLDSDTIRIGQTLQLLEPFNNQPRIEYVVTIGDTLSDIARRFDVGVNDIRDQEGRQLPGDIIHPGERLSLLINAGGS